MRPDRGRLPQAALLLIACGALVLRTRFLVGHGGALVSPTDYDTGVYFSASALLLRGVLPYRDFVFVHPPGIAWFYGLTSWWPDVAAGFASARWLACVVGAVNSYLAGMLVLRTGSLFGAVTTAVLYALYPDAVATETSTFLEPVLNLACLASASFWLSMTKETPRRTLTAGFLAGAACTVKLLGGIWVVAAIASAPRGRFASTTSRFLAAGIASGALLLAPVALLAPGSFLSQVVLFQLSRPPDGTPGAAARLPLILDNGHLVATILAAVAILGIVVTALRFGRSAVSREERFFTIAAVLTVAAFLASSSYWTQYNAYLAPSECVLAGLGTARLLRGRSRKLAMAIAVVITAAGAVLLRRPFRQTLREAEQLSPELIALRGASRGVLEPGDSLFAFDPSWGLVAGRLPAFGDGAPVVVDSYGAMLLTAMRTGQRYTDADKAFRGAPAQPEVRARIERSRLLILGSRGNWQLPEADRAWVRSHSLCLTPEAKELCVRKTIAQPFDSIVRVPEGSDVGFGEGWWGEEGSRPESFRWMSGRGIVRLPAVSGPARLHLEFDLPSSAVRAPATISLVLDGRTLDRFVASSREVSRSYDVGASGSARTLVMTTDSTSVPARSEGSTDERELGLALKRIIWLNLEGWSRLLG